MKGAMRYFGSKSKLKCISYTGGDFQEFLNEKYTTELKFCTYIVKNKNKDT